MTRKLPLLASGLAAAILTACRTTAPGDETGPEHTLAYYIRVECSSGEVTIQTNKVLAGKTPIILKVFGDPPGTFHDFGLPVFKLEALPRTTNEFLQTKAFRAGKASAPGDRIPGLMFFDMTQRAGGLIIDSIPAR